MPEFEVNGYPDMEDSSNTKTRFQSMKIRNMDDYHRLYKKSIDDSEGFWNGIADEFAWKKKPVANNSSYNFDLNKGPIHIRWFESGLTNLSYNALDVNVKNGLGNKIAYYWEGNEVGDRSSITYRQLLKMVCKFANVLKSKGVKKGDRVAIYMPMIIEGVAAMLACTRIGAPHTAVFAGFSSASLAERMLDCQCRILVTADGLMRARKLVCLKELADGAVKLCSEKNLHVKTIVFNHLGSTINNTMNGYTSQKLNKPSAGLQISWNPEVDSWWEDEMAAVSPACEPEWVDAEHPLFILYTSGSTGKPKGVLHTTGGYMVYAATTFHFVFGHKSSDVYFCTADFGWITGHTYGVYGPLLQGASSVLFQGTPTYPDPGRYWSVVEHYNVSKFYTAPTAVRTLMKYGDEPVTRHCLDSLEVLGSVGEPINPEAWQWYHRVVGQGKCAIVDTYWQSETGGHALTPLPHCTPLKPGSATFPFFGVLPALLDDQGNEIEGPGEGNLVFKKPWPGMMRGLYGNTERFEITYFNRFPGYYCTGDGARRDSDGCFWITGRTDDMLNVSGHLLSTAEVEAALQEHPQCVEAAAVALPHPVKGECLYCFVVLSEGILPEQELVAKLREQVRATIGTFASPDFIHFASSLPKTRSGKILRRILRKIAAEEHELGDTSTVADDSIISELFSTRSEVCV